MFLHKNEKRNDIIFVSLFALVCIGLFFLPSGYEERLPEGSYFARGQVKSVDNSRVFQNVIVKIGEQDLEVELLEGPHKGKTITVSNQLTGKMEIDEVYKPGRDILVEYNIINGVPAAAFARGNYRLHLELFLVLLFVLMLVLLGGWTGLKAVFSFIFAVLMIWKVMIPLFLKGKDPIVTGLLVVVAMTAAICFLVGGLHYKGLVTFISTLLGLFLTCILAEIFTKYFRIHGAVRPYAENLLYSGFDYLNLTRIFIASVVLSCSGAVIDLAMDISVSMNEIIKKKPDIGLFEHIHSGMAVGRAAVGTMTTTLLLAYSGGYIALLMLSMGMGIPVMTMLNKNFVAAEIINTIVGSFGVVTVAPFTAITGGIIYRIGRKNP
ncbi:MAG: YibE/F family protein [Sedimentisphaerales bacterium]|nr:YibE/F family protein [Sedimentisphaerales bacterium]